MPKDFSDRRVVNSRSQRPEPEQGMEPVGNVMVDQMIATRVPEPALSVSSADLSAVRSEITWRRPPDVVDGAALPCDILASRWSDPHTATRAETAEITADYHTIGIAMAPTRMAFEHCGRTIHDGPVMRGMLQVSGPAQRLRGVFRAPCDFLHIHVASQFLGRCAEAAAMEPTGPTILAGTWHAADRAIVRLGEALLLCAPAGGAYGTLYTDSIGRAIVARLLALAVHPARKDASQRIVALPQWRLRRVLDYIEAHLASPLTLGDLARACGLSPMHFAAQFRLATGLRPHEFVLRRRIERAQLSLATSGVSQVEIALSVGFQAQSHFCSMFRRLVGESPGRWRRENGKHR